MTRDKTYRFWRRDEPGTPFFVDAPTHERAKTALVRELGRRTGERHSYSDYLGELAAEPVEEERIRERLEPSHQYELGHYDRPEDDPLFYDADHPRNNAFS